jgi:hypothetical protein
MTRSKRKTAAELMAELEADPTFVARRCEDEQVHRAREAALRQEEAPLIEDLAKAGIHVQTVLHLVSEGSSSPKALPLLLEHLQRPYPERVRESIARALAMPEAVGAWPQLVHLFETKADPTTTGVKWALGCTLASLATADGIVDLIRLVQDRRHGGNRIALVDGLARSSDARARSALLEAGTDPELEREVRKALRQQRRHSSALVAGQGGVQHAIGERQEVSINFDAQDVEPFLRRLGQLVSGFGAPEIAKVTDVLDALELDGEGELFFEVKHKDRLVPLHLTILLDDTDAPDLFFETSSYSYLREGETGPKVNAVRG